MQEIEVIGNLFIELLKLYKQELKKFNFENLESELGYSRSEFIDGDKFLRIHGDKVHTNIILSEEEINTLLALKSKVMLVNRLRNTILDVLEGVE